MYKIIFSALCSLLLMGCNGQDEGTNGLELATKVEQLVDPAQSKVQQWPAYQAFDQNMRTICNTNALNAIGLQERLVHNVSAMLKQIPEDLRTPSVVEKINFINEKVTRFNNEIDDNELHERVVDRHIKEIIEAFDDLNKEINETVIKHV